MIIICKCHWGNYRYVFNIISLNNSSKNIKKLIRHQTGGRNPGKKLWMGESGSVIGVIICDRWASSTLCLKTKNIQYFAISVAYQWWLSDPQLIIIIIWTPKTHNFTRPQLKPGWTASKTFWAKITQQQPYWERSGERALLFTTSKHYLSFYGSRVECIETLEFLSVF